MAIFTVVQQPGTNSAKLAAAVAAEFQDNFRPLAPNVWLVSGAGVASEISDRLGVTGGTNGSAVVMEVASYFGRANPEVWSWMKTKLEGPPVG